MVDATCLIDDVTIEAVEIGDGSSVEATSPVPANGANYSEVTITVLNANGEPISGIPVSEITVNCTGSGNTIIGRMHRQMQMDRLLQK
jgi:alcohol dehydrogenase YqhD (iron-dependent ADH family)